MTVLVVAIALVWLLIRREIRSLDRPNVYENLIVKANADGEIVRLEDVAKVEVGWSIP